MSYDPGSGTGSSSVGGSTDVVLSNPSNQQMLSYDSSVQKWKNAAVTSGSIADGSITSAKIANGAIVNADISGAAAIDQTKVSGLTTDLSAKLGQPLQISTSATITPGTTPTFVIRS